jgi:hypothetical protein
VSIEERLAELEERVAALEGSASSGAEGSASRGWKDTFWALEGLRERAPADRAGAVLYAGFVDLPTGEHYEWQRGHPVDELLARELDQDWTDTASSLAALGHPVRLLLLHAILHGTRTAADLAGLEGVGTTGQIYHHLRQLTAAGWLRTTTRGQYAVPPERVVPLLTMLAASR